MLTSFHKGLLAALGVQVLLLLLVITRSNDGSTLASRTTCCPGSTPPRSPS